MTAQLIDGKAVAAKVHEEVRIAVAERVKRGQRAPTLATVLVGEDPASHVYVGSKRKLCEQLGIRSEHVDLPASVTQAELLATVARLNANPAIDGILVQLPLPKGLDSEAVVRAIDPKKDVDGLNPYNAGLLVAGGKGLRPCTPSGCLRLLDEAGVALAGKRAIVVGRSNLVGKPVALMLLERNCTVTMAHSKTADLGERVREGDVVIAAVGVPELVKGDWIKPGAVVIDVGVNRVAPKKLVGDVEFEAARQRAAWITPVPGGVGPMTVAMLMANTLLASELRVSPRA